MKFMKLGSRPDTFYTSEAVRSVCTEVSSDLIVQIKGSRYLLHKFPLLSKCLKLQRICSQNLEASNHQMIQLPDFPGGVEAFELCAKFCYGITVTLSAYNIVAARCAAEYLQMTEDVEKGNLIYKIEVFFNSCILHGWKDSIVTLQCTKAFPNWSEDLGITSRCIDAVAVKVLENPAKMSLSHSHSRRGHDVVSCNGHKPATATAKVWWAEDLAELSIDLYWRTIIAIKAGGKVPANLIGDALKTYASRWLPSAPKKQSEPDDATATATASSPADGNQKNKLLLESIISLLPSEKGAVSCSFLLKLLKAANILNASSSSKMELTRRVGLQLEEANFHDLLIPSISNKHEMIYDVDTVISILEHFLLQGQSPPTSPARTKDGLERRRRSRSAENAEFEFQESRRSSSSSHSSKLRVARIMDRYLQEIVKDPNLPLAKFISLAEAVPDFARLDHDDLYKAIDIYLKEHPSLNKIERKRLCRMLDCKKLSMDICMHAAQNELLPLRVVVQVLFFEQARAAMGSTASGQINDLPSNIKALLTQSKPKASLSTNATVAPDDQWSISGLKSPKSSMSTLRMKLEEDDDKELDESFRKSSSKIKSLICAIPPRPKKILGKLWSVNRSTAATAASEKN